MTTFAALPQLLETRPRDLGGFEVRRLLPMAERQSVGPFVFFDHMGPARFPPGGGIDVRPHPQIGLATITYLFDGEIMHRDSLGFVQPIRPGDVNWMTAGRGIVHSERTSPELRDAGSMLHGLQLWIALPRHSEETEPAFVHHAQAVLPQVQLGLTRLRLIVGSIFGAVSPVQTFSPMFYFDAQMAAQAAFDLPPDYPERAIYVVSGAVEVLGYTLNEGQMLVLPPGVPVSIKSVGGARLVLLGGEPLDGPRFVWWNLVSSSRERIEQAKLDWVEGRFSPVPGETEFIPLPDK
jgi:redox-sensitive bicupin YhaK (pirin superfamily)